MTMNKPGTASAIAGGASTVAATHPPLHQRLSVDIYERSLLGVMLYLRYD